jgi:hypothetical protein
VSWTLIENHEVQNTLEVCVRYYNSEAYSPGAYSINKEGCEEAIFVGSLLLSTYLSTQGNKKVNI